MLVAFKHLWQQEVTRDYIFTLDDIDLESFGKKKKKKKTRDAIDMNELEEALPDDDEVRWYTKHLLFI